MAHDTRLNVMRQREPAREVSARAIFERVPRPSRSGGAHAEGVRSLYIHIPFCFHKCHYCDFYSIVDTRDRQEAFVDRLRRELSAQSAWGAGTPLQTIFVGGGTPTLLRVELWERVLRHLHETFDLSAMAQGGDGEFTVECNPETATPDLMSVLRHGGVNRVSIGAQSFDPRHLKTLERWHDPENVARAIEMARAAGIARQSIDLIFGIPAQTLDDWRRDLERAIALRTKHLSCYNLTYEPGTAMTARLSRDEIQPADEGLEVEMYTLTADLLAGAGLSRYEVSNYAREGDEARHNLAYWRGESWLACGPSASGHLRTLEGGWRWKNIPRLDDYLGFDDEGFAPVKDAESPNEGRALRERLMTGLRLREGIDARETCVRADCIQPGLGDRLHARVESLRARGMLRRDGECWRVTHAGWLHADGVAAELMSLVP
jgi:oxygen-independent coproporphyrinogen-3 oxidase